jgi:hypothetical protein
MVYEHRRSPRAIGDYYEEKVKYSQVKNSKGLVPMESRVHLHPKGSLKGISAGISVIDTLG